MPLFKERGHPWYRNEAFLIEIFCWIEPKSKSDIWAQSNKKAMLDARLMYVVEPKASFFLQIVQNPPIPASWFFLCVKRRYRVIWNLYSLRPAWTSCFSISIQREVILPYEFALIDGSVWKLMKWFTKLSDLNHF